MGPCDKERRMSIVGITGAVPDMERPARARRITPRLDDAGLLFDFAGPADLLDVLTPGEVYLKHCSVRKLAQNLIQSHNVNVHCLPRAAVRIDRNGLEYCGNAHSIVKSDRI
jgi:hypothetical protein